MLIDIWHINGKGFHFGRHGLGQEKSSEHFTSDSLFAALVARLAELKGAAAVKPWIEMYIKGGPAFVLSSAFPQAGGVRFFPTLLHTPGVDEKLPENVGVKDLKRVRYVSEKIFRMLLSGTSLGEVYAAKGCTRLQKGKVLVHDSEESTLPEKVANGEAPIWMMDTRPRVTIDRVNSSSTLYHTGRTVFGPECGLWFGVFWQERTAKGETELKELLDDLGDAGIGGDRSSGFGHALITFEGTCELPDALGGPWVSLGRYLPAEDESGALTSPQAAYSIETVGGWVDSPGSKAERRRSVRLLAEGSILGPLDKPVPGQMVDVQPSYGGTRPLGHEVWRNGFAMAVGMKARH